MDSHNNIMARLTIYKDNYADATAVSNRFIDEYMADANDAQLKVYLYLLRMFAAGQATSVSDIADKFNHTEKDVVRALKYWEKHHLLDLDYDGNQNLTGIRLQDLRVIPAASAAPSANFPGEHFSVSEDASGSAKSSAPMESPVPEEPLFCKPAYSTEQLREFKARENTSQLLFIAESYIGRPLTPTEMKSILFFTDVLQFSDDLIDYLIQYCVDRDKKDFKYIEKVAISWAQSGITTPKQAQRHSAKYDKNVYAVMNALGKSSSPTAKEMEFINRWIKIYGFSMDIIFEACERTVLATDKHRFEYAEGILSSWKQENVHHKADIRKIDELYQKKKSSPKAFSVNKFNQFTQNQYDFDALEQQLLSH
ncbi:MAG: DnaD domain protein [Clostridium sp.]|nr:DnaD domain protein [Clostridium sp.]